MGAHVAEKDPAERLLARRRPRRAVQAHMDHGALERTREVLQRQREQTRARGDRDALKEADAELDKVATRIREGRVVLTFEALRSKDWRALLEAHPPTPAQKGRGESYDADGFHPALLQECSVDGVRAPAWRALLDELSLGDATALTMTVVSVNQVPSVEVVEA